MRTYRTYIILFTCITSIIQKRKPILYIILSAIISTSIVTFGSVNMYTIHKTTYNITTTKEINPTKICFISDVHYPNANNPQRLKKITNTLMKVKPDFYLLGKDFVNESTSKYDMGILFKQLKRLTKVALVYFVYGNHENKIKFTKNNITILNDQEVHLNNIILIGRKDYKKKTKENKRLQSNKQNLQHHPRPSTTRNKRKH